MATARGSMPAALRRLLAQTVLHAPYTGTDAYGHASYGPDTELPARIVHHNRLVRDAAGVERLADTEVWLDGLPEISPRDRLTLPDGSTPPLLAVESFPDAQGRPHHQKAFF